MAKELPYFKFEPSQWENGNIQLCSHEAQGVFINLCSMYWQRLGDLPYKLALQKICNGNATALKSLCEENVIKVIDGNICIDFLNEQLSEFENASKVNSENARVGWEKRKKNANAMRPHSERNAIREEKRREERENITHGDGKVFVTIAKRYANEKVQKIYNLKTYMESTGQLNSLQESGWVWFDEFIQAHSGKVFNEPDHLYSAFRKFCIEYKPPARAPDKFKDAAWDKGLWTLEAWEKAYNYKLTHDEEFRLHFGYGKLSVSKTVGS